MNIKKELIQIGYICYDIKDKGTREEINELKKFLEHELILIKDLLK